MSVFPEPKDKSKFPTPPTDKEMQSVGENAMENAMASVEVIEANDVNLADDYKPNKNGSAVDAREPFNPPLGSGREFQEHNKSRFAPQPLGSGFANKANDQLVSAAKIVSKDKFIGDLERQLETYAENLKFRHEIDAMLQGQIDELNTNIEAGECALRILKSDPVARRTANPSKAKTPTKAKAVKASSNV